MIINPTMAQTRSSSTDDTSCKEGKKQEVNFSLGARPELSDAAGNWTLDNTCSALEKRPGNEGDDDMYYHTCNLCPGNYTIDCKITNDGSVSSLNINGKQFCEEKDQQTDIFILENYDKKRCVYKPANITETFLDDLNDCCPEDPSYDEILKDFDCVINATDPDNVISLPECPFEKSQMFKMNNTLCEADQNMYMNAFDGQVEFDANDFPVEGKDSDTDNCDGNFDVFKIYCPENNEETCTYIEITDDECPCITKYGTDYFFWDEYGHNDYDYNNGEICLTPLSEIIECRLDANHMKDGDKCEADDVFFMDEDNIEVPIPFWPGTIRPKQTDANLNNCAKYDIYEVVCGLPAGCGDKIANNYDPNAYPDNSMCTYEDTTPGSAEPSSTTALFTAAVFLFAMMY